MRLRARVIALIGCLFAVLGVAQFLVQREVLLPSFAELEREAAATDMLRVIHAVDRELELLGVMTADWGNWDATYAYMIDHDPAFIDINMTVSSIEGLRVNAVAFVDLSGAFAWAKGVAPQTGEPLELDLLERGALPEDSVWQAALRSGTQLQGFLHTNQGPMLVALAPVLDGNGEGPHRGMVLLGRLLTDDEIARIGAQARIPRRAIC